MTTYDITSPHAASDHAGSDHAADERIADEVRTHHAAMVATLDRLSAAVRDASPDGFHAARHELAEWFETVLVPHADEEESTTYAAAAGLAEGRLLIEAMVREHVLIKRLVALFAESEPVAAGAYARAVFEAFDSHQGKENDVILPLLVGAPGVSLAHAMGEHHGHHQVGDHDHHGHDHHGHDHVHH